MSRKKAKSDSIKVEDLYKEILKLKKETHQHKSLISSLLQRTMEIELKLVEPQQNVLVLKTELMTLAASLDERLDKHSLLSTPAAVSGHSYRFRNTVQRLIVGTRVTNALRVAVSERQQRDDVIEKKEFQQTLSDLEHMLDILKNIGQCVNVPGLPVEFLKKLRTSLCAIDTILEKKYLTANH